jgi:inner membrane protein
MDTGSHLLFGFTLAGLAHLDPAVSVNPELAHAILAGTLVGSHAPDFDTLTRVKGYNVYIRHHRGVTHSLPALLFWPALLSLIIGASFNLWPFIIHLFVWIMAAVIFHVFLDLCNAYGVQCLRPFSRKWQHLDILSLFDPFLFALHLTAAVLWIIGRISPASIFPLLYGITFIYILFRGLVHAAAAARVKRELGLSEICQLIPDMHWFKYQFVLETSEHFHTGKIHYGRVMVKDIYPKMKESENPAIEATLKTDGVRAFLSFAQRVHVTCVEQQEGYVVQWRDVRFWYDHQLPFGVDVQLDHEMQVLNSHIGWNKKSWDPPYV